MTAEKGGGERGEYSGKKRGMKTKAAHLILSFSFFLCDLGGKRGKREGDKRGGHGGEKKGEEKSQICATITTHIPIILNIGELARQWATEREKEKGEKVKRIFRRGKEGTNYLHLASLRCFTSVV